MAPTLFYVRFTIFPSGPHSLLRAAHYFFQWHLLFFMCSSLFFAVSCTVIFISSNFFFLCHHYFYCMSLVFLLDFTSFLTLRHWFCCRALLIFTVLALFLSVRIKELHCISTIFSSCCYEVRNKKIKWKKIYFYFFKTRKQFIHSHSLIGTTLFLFPQTLSSCDSE